MPCGVLERKFQTFSVDPVGSVKSRFIRDVKALLQRRGERRLRRAGALEALEKFLANRPPTALPPDYDDLWFLYRSVRERQPRTILEFGSGCSTAVLAQAALDNAANGAPPARVYSIDSDPFWAKAAADCIPERLRAHCEVLHRPAVAVERHGVPGFQHADLPEIAPDFIYLDGPQLTPERQVAVDVLDLEPRLPPTFFVVIDGRIKNTAFLREHLSRRVGFKQRRYSFNHVIWGLDD